MKKINTEILNLLSEPTQFETACELIESFDHLKRHLMDEFGKKLQSEISIRMKDSAWKVVSNGFFSEEKEIELYLNKDVNQSVCYFIRLHKQELYYGVLFYREECLPEKITSIFSKAKELKEKFGWKLANEKEGWWTIYYRIDSGKFKSNADYRVLLPDVMQLTTNSIVDVFINDFNKEIQDFIESSIF